MTVQTSGRRNPTCAAQAAHRGAAPDRRHGTTVPAARQARGRWAARGTPPSLPSPGAHARARALIVRPDPELALSSGAHARVRGPEGAPTVVLVNGGVARDAPGTYSATTSWLADRIAPLLPRLRFVEVRYRVRSWNRLDLCIDDTRAALDDLAADVPVALVGFSMGGAVAVSASDHPSVRSVIALSPWLPRELHLSQLRGRRVVIYQGSLDAYLPGVPGISPAHSRAGWQRMLDAGIPAEYTLVRGGVHGLALNAPWGGRITLPRARRVGEAVRRDLERFGHGEP